METVTDIIFLGSKITADGDSRHEIKRCFLLGRKAMSKLDSILKSRDITLLTKVCIVKAMVFPVIMYGCESWTVKTGECQRIDAFELWCWRKTPESPLDCKEVKSVNPEGHQPWVFTGRTDAEVEAPKVWPPDGKSRLIGKDPNAQKDRRQEEKGTTEVEIVEWHHGLNGHESEQALGDGEGQGSLVCYSPWGQKETDRTEGLNSYYVSINPIHLIYPSFLIFPFGNHVCFLCQLVFLFCKWVYLIYFWFHIQMISYNVCFSLSNFPQYDNILVHTCSCKWHYFILFYGWVISHCIYELHLLYTFICQRTFTLFLCLGYYKRTAMNIEEKEMATHSSILAWRILWTEEPWWAAVHRVTQSRTRLKRLSSSSSYEHRGACMFSN